MPRCLLIACLALQMLVGCQLSLPGKTAGSPPPVSAAAGDITVTSLDAPPAAASSGSPPDSPAAAVVPPTVPDPKPATPPQGPAAGADAPAPSGAEPVAAPEEPVPVKSAAQLSCERKGGRYAGAGASGAKACVTPTRDGGKRCTKEGDCEGLCLARSQTCAPIKPLFGCNDILQADGRRVTLCID